ncbi:hypothetical protein [Arthrobacter sp. M4]|uniref:hypothetical protein n=1 Tax=Arthrobacter sp. M4 TaxID=218160 RepID=UPI001CDD4682|nr:hypothetical protein [Arthrobacter sp. M4]MCA4131459.1 hypothetical protein [Arthrobacter sp. M4]
MTWWSWILLWVALIALSLLLHVLLGVRLFRQAMATVKELGAAGEKLGHLGPFPEPDKPDNDGGKRLLPPGSAVFAPPEQMRHDYLAAKAARREARRKRRVERRAERGQPQSLHDIDFR